MDTQKIAFMSLPPESTDAYLTDVDYRLQVEGAMDKALRKPDVGAVVLFYGGEDVDDDYASNPGLEEHLRKRNVPEEVIAFILSLEDSKLQGKLVNELFKRPEATLDDLKALHDTFKAEKQPLTPEEVAMYSVIEDRRQLRNWLKREIRLMKEQMGVEEFRAVAAREEYAGWVRRVADWWEGTGHPDMANRSFDDARVEAQRWEVGEPAAEGEYRRTKPENVLYTDPETGYTVQNVEVPDLAAEGGKMKHCVGKHPHYAEGIKEGVSRILSLRDPQNRPHVTIELVKHGDPPVWMVNQIQGVGNTQPKEEYVEILRRFFPAVLGDIEWHGTSGYVSHNIANLNLWQLAADMVLGIDALQEDPYRGRPQLPDLSPEQVVGLVSIYAANTKSAVQHRRKSTGGRRVFKFEEYKHPVIQEDSKTWERDNYGIRRATNRSYRGSLSPIPMALDIRYFLAGEDGLGRPLTPDLAQALDQAAEAIAGAAILAWKLQQKYNDALDRYQEKQRALIDNLKRVIEEAKSEPQESLTPKDRMSLAVNQLLLEEYKNDLERSERYREKAVHGHLVYEIAAFAYNTSGAPPISREAERIAKKGSYKSDARWTGEMGGENIPRHTDSSWLYFLDSLFQKLTGHPLFKEERGALGRGR